MYEIYRTLKEFLKTFLRKCFFVLHLQSITEKTICLSGGIGRRARLKLVYYGVRVRFPPQVLEKTL